MYKIIIFFLPPFSWAGFERGWQKFLGLAEQMPGLRKEVVSDMEEKVFGPPDVNYRKIHELYFDSREALEAALNSEAGQRAGQWLHSFTQGRFLLVIARHMEATPNEFKKPKPDLPESP
ncbi:MAG: hypothetical protein Fur0043_01980 [Anaerolineales bacterium]